MAPPIDASKKDFSVATVTEKDFLDIISVTEPTVRNWQFFSTWFLLVALRLQVAGLRSQNGRCSLGRKKVAR
jgi:hypothetical protein